MESDNSSDKEDIKQTKDNLSDIKKNEENIKSSDNEEEIGKKSDAEYGDDDIEEDIDWDNMTPEKAYEILAKKYPIPYTDWNDPKDIERRRKEVRGVVTRVYTTTIRKKRKTIDKNNYINRKINYICSFEKIYAKYKTGKCIPLSSNDYYNVFAKIFNDTRDAKLHNIMINVGFVVNSGAKDKDVIDNFEYRKWYSECIDSLIQFERYAGYHSESALGDFIIGEESQLIRVMLTDFIVKSLSEQIYKIRTWLQTK